MRTHIYKTIECSIGSGGPNHTYSTVECRNKSGEPVHTQHYRMQLWIRRTYPYTQQCRMQHWIRRTHPHIALRSGGPTHTHTYNCSFGSGGPTNTQHCRTQHWIRRTYTHRPLQNVGTGQEDPPPPHTYTHCTVECSIESRKPTQTVKCSKRSGGHEDPHATLPVVLCRGQNNLLEITYKIRNTQFMSKFNKEDLGIFELY